MQWLNNLNKAFQAGYSSFDDKFAGGMLPGGAAPDPAGFVRNVAKDALPGKNSTSVTRTADKVASKGAGLTENILQGNVANVAAQSYAGRYADKAREHLVEEGTEKIVKNVGGRLTRRAAGVVAFPLGIYDTINDAGAAYGAVLDHNTGKNLDEHINVAREVRDNRHQFRGGHVATDDGSIPTIEQSNSAENAIVQEIKARANQAAESFNPLKGDWGVTELLYGR